MKLWQLLAIGAMLAWGLENINIKKERKYCKAMLSCVRFKCPDFKRCQDLKGRKELYQKPQ